MTDTITVDKITRIQVLLSELRTYHLQRGDLQMLSEAYLRLRNLIPGAFDTPHGPSPEQVWTTTEQALRRALADHDKPNLGLATTGELIDELRARIGSHGGLNYRTVDG